MLRRQGGSSHVIQAEVPPLEVTRPGLFATPPGGDALATFPLAWRQELRPRLLDECGLAQVGFSLCYHH